LSSSVDKTVNNIQKYFIVFISFRLHFKDSDSHCFVVVVVGFAELHCFGDVDFSV